MRRPSIVHPMGCRCASCDPSFSIRDWLAASIAGTARLAAFCGFLLGCTLRSLFAIINF